MSLILILSMGFTSLIGLVLLGYTVLPLVNTLKGKADKNWMELTISLAAGVLGVVSIITVFSGVAPYVSAFSNLSMFLLFSVASSWGAYAPCFLKSETAPDKDWIKAANALLFWSWVVFVTPLMVGSVMQDYHRFKQTDAIEMPVEVEVQTQIPVEED